MQHCVDFQCQIYPLQVHNFASWSGEHIVQHAQQCHCILVVSIHSHKQVKFKEGLHQNTSTSTDTTSFVRHCLLVSLLCMCTYVYILCMYVRYYTVYCDVALQYSTVYSQVAPHHTSVYCDVAPQYSIVCCYVALHYSTVYCNFATVWYCLLWPCCLGSQWRT